MAKAAENLQRPLMLSPKVMHTALKRSAEKAQRMADAFGQKVPVVQRRSRSEVKTAH
jgi:hypothetical protein